MGEKNEIAGQLMASPVGKHFIYILAANARMSATNLPGICGSLQSSTTEMKGIFGQHVCIFQKENVSIMDFAICVKVSYGCAA